jgi:hypothetical protein
MLGKQGMYAEVQTAKLIRMNYLGTTDEGTELECALERKPVNI